MQTPDVVQAVMPFVGMCALCGAPDARHRMYDAIVGRYDAGESIVDLSADYHLDEEVVFWIAMWWQDGLQSWHQRAFKTYN